jgi:hypothetical protein
MKRYILYAAITVVLLLGPASFISWRSKATSRPTPAIKSYAAPPSAVLICGIQDHPCVAYTIAFHEPTKAWGDREGEGVTDYKTKTISVAESNDRFENVSALQHEVYHAVLWERGFRDTDNWDIHKWIYFSDGAFPILFHDNPELVNYIRYGY